MKYTRIMAKTCAAQDIGPEGCWLLSVIVGIEDVKRYAGAVTFYNEQLLSQCGFTSQKSLIRARQKCVDHGWLHYEQGAKRKPGKYWVTVPQQHDGVSDFMGDETDTMIELIGTGSSEPTIVQDKEERTTAAISETSIVTCASDLESQVQRNGNERAAQVQEKGSASGSPSTLSLFPIPDPIPKKTKAKKITPSSALDLLFESFWDSYGKIGSKQPARKNWEAQLQRVSKTMSIDEAAEKIRLGAESYRRYLSAMERPPITKHAQGWLTEQRYEDDYEAMIQAEVHRRQKADAERESKNQQVAQVPKRQIITTIER
jgi:hypothetical protein